MMWAGPELTEALAACARRGWPVGTHAMGDSAVSLLLTAIGEAGQQASPLPPGTLVVEHGGLIGRRIADAVSLGAHVTVQQALLDGLGPAFLNAWGPDRTAALRLYTVAGARFLGPPATGTLVPGAPADLVAYPADPFTCPAEQLLDLAPAATVLGGRLTYRRE
jgi:predicted amidohydrolase YtcJ